jgi:hypothetical protein
MALPLSQARTWPPVLHIPAFGNPNYKGGPIRLVDKAEGVRIVAELMESRTVVLMCVCADHKSCHRSVAANAISEATGAETVHLSPSDFSTSVQQLDLLSTYHPVTP